MWLKFNIHKLVAFIKIITIIKNISSTKGLFLINDLACIPSAPRL